MNTATKPACLACYQTTYHSLTDSHFIFIVHSLGVTTPHLTYVHAPRPTTHMYGQYCLNAPAVIHPFTLSTNLLHLAHDSSRTIKPQSETTATTKHMGHLHITHYVQCCTIRISIFAVD